MKTAIGLLVLVLVACSAPAASVPEPEVTPTSGRYTDAEQAEILSESIELVYGTQPGPDWYSAFVSLTVEDRWAYVQTTLSETDVDAAEAMCRDIAIVTHDDDAEPIGVTDVLIFGLGNADLADCDVPVL